MKSTVEEIRKRFDQDVKRFSNLESGQRATVDAPLVMDLVARAAAATNPVAEHALDIGCGAGNYALKLLEHLPSLQVDLLDLSEAMLSRANLRLTDVSAKVVRTMHADVRNVTLEDERYDIVVAAATLHHLRTDDEWEGVFAKIFRAMKAGGSIWIADLVEHSNPAIQALMWERYGAYLTELDGSGYRDRVFAYIGKEDTPRPITYQIDLLRKVGFREVDVLHKNSVFAAFGGVK